MSVDRVCGVDRNILLPPCPAQASGTGLSERKKIAQYRQNGIFTEKEHFKIMGPQNNITLSVMVIGRKKDVIKADIFFYFRSDPDLFFHETDPKIRIKMKRIRNTEFKH